MLTVDRRLQGQPKQQEPTQGFTRKAGNQPFAEHIGGKQNREAVDGCCTSTISRAKSETGYPELGVWNEEAADLSIDSLGWKGVALPAKQSNSGAEAGPVCSSFTDMGLGLGRGLNSSSATTLLWHCASHGTSPKLGFFACKTSLQHCEN